MKKNTNFFERIRQIIDYKGFKSVNEFALNGLKYKSSEKINRLKNNNKQPSVEILIDISNMFEDINASWLLTGNGPMIKENAPPAPPNEDYNKLKDELIESQREVIRLQKEIAELKATKSHKHPAAGSMAGKLEKK